MWGMMRRICMLILGLKGLKGLKTYSCAALMDAFFNCAFSYLQIKKHLVMVMVFIYRIFYMYIIQMRFTTHES